jgi:hypothetical protein
VDDPEIVGSDLIEDVDSADVDVGRSKLEMQEFRIGSEEERFFVGSTRRH